MTEFQGFSKIPRLNRDIIITEKIDGTNAQLHIEEQPITLKSGQVVPFLVGSRNRWIFPENDNHSFARWAYANTEALLAALGPGKHFGEWWGPGIQRGYGQASRTFSLFNVSKWGKVDAYLDPRCIVPGMQAGAGVDPPSIRHQTDHAGVKRCACREARKAISLNLDGGRVRCVPVLYEGPWHGEIKDGEWTMGGWAPDICMEYLRRHGSLASPGFMRPEGIVVFHTAGGVLFKATLEKDEQHKGEERATK